MGIQHSIHDDVGIVVSIWDGPVTDGDLIPCYRRLYEDPEWKPGFHEVVDLRKADLTQITGGGLLNLSHVVASYAKDHEFKTAVVAPENLPFGLARMYEAFAAESQEKVMVFRKLREALEWVGGEGLDIVPDNDEVEPL